MVEIFDELFKLFEKYDDDMTVYCESLDGEALECHIEDHDKLEPSERELLVKIKSLLGKNWNQKLGKLFFQYKKVKSSGKGSFKFKYPDGSIYEVHSKTIVKDSQIGGKHIDNKVDFSNINKPDIIQCIGKTNQLLQEIEAIVKNINLNMRLLTHQY